MELQKIQVAKAALQTLHGKQPELESSSKKRSKCCSTVACVIAWGRGYVCGTRCAGYKSIHILVCALLEGALDALVEGYTVQRTLRSGTISRLVIKPSRDTVVVSLITDACILASLIVWKVDKSRYMLRFR